MTTVNHYSRYVAIDFVRIFAVSLVVWFHMSPFFGVKWQETWGYIGRVYELNYGTIAVTILIIISGLVLELNYGHKKLQWWTFMLKRLKHIYGMYLPCIILALSIYLMRNKSPLTFIEWECNLTGTCAMQGIWGGRVDGPAWFIGVIVLLYALFPYLSQVIKNIPTGGSSLCLS